MVKISGQRRDTAKAAEVAAFDFGAGKTGKEKAPVFLQGLSEIARQST
jgi:hypothetical protein